jgi:hypothetical protein
LECHAAPPAPFTLSATEEAIVIKANARQWALGMAICAGFTGQALAAPPLTTIQDTLYRADGTLYSGYVQVEWKSFEASDNTLVPAQSLSLRVYQGLFRTKLVPTTTASAGAIYSVRYVSDGRLQGLEYWPCRRLLHRCGSLRFAYRRARVAALRNPAA